MKKALLALAVAGAAVSAQADTTISGQVNSAVVFGGSVNDETTVDNNTTGTRFRIKSSKKAGELTYGTRLEYQLQDNSSSSLTDSLATDGGEVRYSDVWVSGSFGKLAVGKGDGAANGTFEAFGLLNFLGGSESHLLWQGATDLRYRDIDGVSRQNRIRYDSPKFGGGFHFAATLDNGDQSEYAVTFKGKVAGGKVDARYGLVDNDAGDVTSYSAAYKHNSGFGIAFSDSEDDRPGSAGVAAVASSATTLQVLAVAADPTTRTEEADWIQVSYDFGKFVVSYGTGDSRRLSETSENQFDTASLVYKPVKGVEVYLNFLDFENADGTSGDATALGSRFKF